MNDVTYPSASVPDLAAAIALNFGESAVHLHRGTPGARLLSTDGLLIADSGGGDAAFNSVTLMRLAADDADRRVHEAVETVAATGRAFSWWVDPRSTPGDLVSRLVAAGLTEVEQVPAMSLELTSAAMTALGASGEFGLEVRRVTDAEELASFAAVVDASMDPPTQSAAEFYARAAGAALDPAGSARFLVGYFDGVPVATVELLPAAGVAGLYNITTLPEYRRRGYASALTSAALRQAHAEGYATAVLEASAAGEPVYRALGFAKCGIFNMLMLGS